MVYAFVDVLPVLADFGFIRFVVLVFDGVAHRPFFVAFDVGENPFGGISDVVRDKSSFMAAEYFDVHDVAVCADKAHFDGTVSCEVFDPTSFCIFHVDK